MKNAKALLTFFAVFLWMHLHGFGAGAASASFLRLQERMAYLARLQIRSTRFEKIDGKKATPEAQRYVRNEIARIERKIPGPISSVWAVPQGTEEEKSRRAKFYDDYLDHQLHLVSVFARNPNEALRLDDSEVLGDRCSQNSVFLTFDDGPDAERTPKILDALKEVKARAVFFVLGSRLHDHSGESTPLLRRMITEGHAIGLHGWDHRVMDGEGLEMEAMRGVERAAAVLRGLCGRKADLFRAPYGRRNLTLLRKLRAAGMQHVLWNIDSLDWNRSLGDDEVRDRVLRLARLYDGGIVLFHDPVPRTAGVLRQVLRQLKSEGFAMGDREDKLGSGSERADLVRDNKINVRRWQ